MGTNLQTLIPVTAIAKWWRQSKFSHFSFSLFFCQLLWQSTNDHNMAMSRPFVSASTPSLAQRTITGGTLRLSAQAMDLASAMLSATVPVPIRSQLPAGEGASQPLRAGFTMVTSLPWPILPMSSMSGPRGEGSVLDHRSVELGKRCHRRESQLEHCGAIIFFQIIKFSNKILFLKDSNIQLFATLC